MKLSELLKQYSPVEALHLERDGIFEILGYATHPINTRPLLVFAGSEKFVDAVIKNPLAYCVVTTPDLARLFPENMGVITTSNPLEAFYSIHHFLHFNTSLYWEDFDNEIHKDAIISPNAIIAKKNVKIGSGTLVEAGAIIHERSIIGKNCAIRSNAVISSEGFEYKRLSGRLELIQHSGGVELKNGVQVHTASLIDKGLFGENTIVGEFSALDNCVHIAHGVKTGSNCLFAAGVVIAAAVLIGDNVRVDPNATLAHELLIGDNAYISMGSVVTDNVKEGHRVSGNFAVDHFQFYRHWMKAYR